MIGLAIIVMCLVPLALSPYRRSKALLHAVCQLELEKEAVLIAGRYKEFLYQKKITPFLLKQERVTLSSPCYEQGVFCLHVVDVIKKEYDKRVYLVIHEEKEWETERHALLKLIVYFTPKGKKLSKKDPHFEYFFTLTQETKAFS